MTEAPYLYTIRPKTSSTDSVELCPAHWRLPPKRSLRAKLKKVVLKDWQTDLSRPSQRSATPKRPSIMRMKDSDDYITARAANPRTGLISPSLGSSTPRFPFTPETPGEALLHTKVSEPPSPTPDARVRPAFRRANEGRKVSAGSNNRWRAENDGWVMDSGVAVASPKVTSVKADAGLVSVPTRHLPNDDHFVVHMPSAQEPQPFAYPGYSAPQIDAFVHYQSKARRVSAEGYDQRLLGEFQRTSADIPEPEKLPQNDCIRAGGMPVPKPSKGIKLAKRRVEARSVIDSRDESPCTGRAELGAGTFAPFASPRTPALPARDHGVTALDNISARPRYNHDQTHLVRRKPVNSSARQQTEARGIQAAERHKNHLAADTCWHGELTKDRPGPRNVPSLLCTNSARPFDDDSSQASGVYMRSADGSRKCSLGCAKDRDGNGCKDNRFAPAECLPSSKGDLFGKVSLPPRPSSAAAPRTTHRTQDQQQTQNCLEISMTMVVEALNYGRHLPIPALPRIGVLEVLNAEDSTPAQKVDAMKSIVSSTGQVLVFLTLATMFWQVGSAVVRICELVFWPLLIPIKVMKWLASAG